MFDVFEQRAQKFRDDVKLFEVERFPGDFGIRLETRFAFFAVFAGRRIDFFECAARGVSYDLGPCFIGFAKRDGVGGAVRRCVLTVRLVLP